MRPRSIGKAQVAGLCIGGNPFSGFSHQTEERSRQMRAYYTDERIHQTLRLAEASGINTFFGRTDDHIFQVLRTYWEEGGRIQWFAQVCTVAGDPDSWRQWLEGAARLGAAAAYLHGGVVDQAYATGQFDRLREFVSRCRGLGLTTGLAGHQPQAHAWIRDHLAVDFQMCSHYNPTDRSQHAEHVATGERWEDEDRARMLETIATIDRPVVHYKIFAGGNRPVLEAFQTLRSHLRHRDVACVGVFLGDDPEMIAKDVALFREHAEGTAA